MKIYSLSEFLYLIKHSPDAVVEELLRDYRCCDHWAYPNSIEMDCNHEEAAL